jgi:hypothetical protein
VRVGREAAEVACGEWMCCWGSSCMTGGSARMHLRLSSSLSGQSQYMISEAMFGMTRSSAMEQEAKANLDVFLP